MKPERALWSVTGGALLFAGYIGLGGRALFGHRERPERLIGKTVRFSAIDWAAVPELPEGRVASFDGGHYLVELTAPVNIEGEVVTSLKVSARHKGHAVSSAQKRGLLAVAGQTPGGKGFIACINTVGG